MYKYGPTLMPVSVVAIAFVMFVAITSAQAQISPPSAATTHESAPSSLQIWDLPVQGPPTTNVLVQGAGFDPLTAVDVYFDSTKLASTTTDKNGAFGNGVVTATGATFTPIQIPANALPGQHTITAQERVGQNSATKSFLVQTDWPQFRFDAQHSGFNSYENVISTANVQNLVLDWQYPLPAQVSGNPVVASGTVYFTSQYPDSTLYAVNATTGALLWKDALEKDNVTPPSIGDGVVCLGVQSLSGGVFAFDAATGTPLWQYQTGYGTSQCTLVNGVAYVGWDDGLLALNANTGKLLWSFATNGGVQAPAVANGVVYFDAIYFSYPNTYVTTLYAVDVNTHQALWQYAWDGIVPANSPPPVVGNGAVYFYMYAFDTHTGDILWQGAGSETIPAVANGVLYGASGYQSLQAVDAITGQVLWRFQTGGMVESSPAVANGVVYFESDDNYAYALDAVTGAQLGKYQVESRGPTSPVVTDGVAYFPSDFGSGALWAFHLPSQASSEHSSSPQRPDTTVLMPNSTLQPSAAATPNPK